MKKLMSLEEVMSDSASERSTANQLNLLVSNTRELAHHRERELEKLQSLLDKVEEHLEEDNLS